MKVLFDHQIFEEQNVGGISRYFYELINSLSHDSNFEYDLSLVHSDNIYLKNLPIYSCLKPKHNSINDFHNFLGGFNFKGKGYIYNRYNQFFPQQNIDIDSKINKTNSIKKIQEGNFTVFHPTYYDDYFLNYIGNKPFVLTVHDLIHQIFPEFGMYEFKDKNQALIDRSQSIITVSENTKRDLIALFNVDENKITVTHLSNSLEVIPNCNSNSIELELPKKFLLYVGGRELYKNFLFFVQVFSSLNSLRENLYIVCTGNPFSQKELYFFNKLDILDKLVYKSVNDDQLKILYQNAEALVYPSMYEGFGLPVLEAFACNCPVIASDTSSLPEIAEDAAVFFNPKSPTSLKSAIERLLLNQLDRQEIQMRGREQLKKFSWQKTTDKTKDVYKKAL